MRSKDRDSLNLDLTRWQTECYRSGFGNVARVKYLDVHRSHLYSYHQWGCKNCHRNFPTTEAHYNHSHGDCQESTETLPTFPSREQIGRLKSKKPILGVDTEEKMWRWIYRIIFPDLESIPSPYWEAIYLNCKRRHIDSFLLLDLLNRQFEMALWTRELLKPLEELLLRLKLLWAKWLMLENYPMASLKAIFGDRP
ncbi:hypothetical protein TWF506_005953 [Arthrobotrys conoides]|uniref:Uncharacterized protein n=1 Tax=Arthrobotrys conoides TaxID=74498 RepID=A0AAN8RQ74_9PEZI